MYNLAAQHSTLTDAIRSAFFDAGTECDPFGIFDADRVQDIETESRDGFIPFTNGGLDAMVMSDLATAWGSGEMGPRESEIIAPFVESAQSDAAHDFIASRDELEHLRANVDYANAGGVLFDYFDALETDHDNRARAYPDGDLFGDKLPAFWSTDAGRLREEFYQFETEYLSEGGEYWLQFRAVFFDTDNSRNITGKPEVYFYAGVNTDFTYGRDKGLVCTFERTYTLDRLTPARVAVIVDAMRGSF